MTKPVGVFAERRLLLHLGDETKPLLVQLGPIIREDRSTSCRYQIHGFDKPVDFKILGVDDIQAIELAMFMVGSHLDLLGRDGKYSIEEEADEIEGNIDDIVGDADKEYGHGFPSRSIPDPPTGADTPYTPPTPD